MTHDSLIVRIPVLDAERFEFLPAFFGERLMLRGESTVYGWMGKLAEQYSGGFWLFYKLANGGHYMAPDAQPFTIHTPNGSERVTADAAGIVATLYALSELAAYAVRTQLADAVGEHLVEQYHLLRDYAATHGERSAIFRAID